MFAHLARYRCHQFSAASALTTHSAANFDRVQVSLDPFVNLLLRLLEELEPLSLVLGTDSEHYTLADTVDFGVTLLAVAS